MTKEEMTKLLMESYDKGVEDAKQAAIIALEETVAVMVAAERERILDICKEGLWSAEGIRQHLNKEQT